MTEALLGLIAMVTLMFLRVPIAFAMALTGFAGLWYMRGFQPAMASASAVIFETGFSYSLSVVPLFVLMGNLVTRAGMSQEVYRAAYAFVGQWRGGLAMSTVLACGGFSAICGSSVATAATMTKVAMPEMRKYGYSDSLATGSIAAGGTLGILIPPSVIMVIYGIMTETNIGALFAAGIIPGAVAILCYLGAVAYTTLRDPNAGPPGDRLKWRDRLDSVRGIGTFMVLLVVLFAAVYLGVLPADWAGVAGFITVIAYALVFHGVMAVVALFALVMGGIYGGIFTPTEAAGVGSAAAFAFALIRRALTWKILLEILAESASTTAMLFTILIGALIFANFMNFTGFAEALLKFVNDLGVGRWGVLLAIIFIYVILGTAMEELSMILLTVPIIFPLIMSLGFDQALGISQPMVGVWFGILIVCVVEIGMISPPVGINIFVLNTLLPDVRMGTIFRGVAPFVVADVVRLAILIAFPTITLFLPKLLFG